jgi:2'-5' RNA ligase
MAGVGRLFLAVVPPERTRHDLAARLDRAFRDDPLPGRVVHPESWHITLRFIGDPGEVNLDRLLWELEELDGEGPFEVSIDGLGAFPRPEKAGVVWAGIDRGEGPLTALAEVVDGATDRAGLGREDRPFVPHLTLTRIRPPTDAWRWLERDPDLRVRWTVDSYVLFRSHRRPGGAEYERLETLPI